MPAEKLNPDIAALAAAVKTELLFGQVLIRRAGAGFELRHMADHQSEPGGLRLLPDGGFRPLAQFNSNGGFRPLKSAPDLPAGWRITAPDERALGTALSHLYPGAVADWFAAQSAPPPVTSWRQFTARQTGMYRITTRLDGAAAGAMMRACCHKYFCLKRRLWTVAGEKCDDPSEKSLMPCLEPCAILLEFARTIARLEQRQTPPPAKAPSQTTTGPAVAECDFNAPNNPRLLRYLFLQKNDPGRAARATRLGGGAEAQPCPTGKFDQLPAIVNQVQKEGR
jgi:hypothetical protein